ncbi:hypothetical protein B0O99DRAFT_695852 [Bisporella sp. PMI_857]|nr:hypothetical protein B0O99DRAFT_695852 [Bisporella sp. PMI_857]
MPPPLFEDRIPTKFRNYHFMIRGWISDSGKRRSEFDEFIKEIAGSLPLKTEEVVIRDEKVAFVRLKSTKNSISLKEGIKRLCWCITNPSKKNHINKVTTRSLLGISPVSDLTLICWVEAIFGTALDNGPQYLENIEVKKKDHIPGWAIVLSFAMIAGINIAGYQVTQSRNKRNASAWTEVNINNKMIKLFGSGGVSAGGNFMENAMPKNKDAPDLEQLRNSYSKVIDKIEVNIENTFNRIKDIGATAHRNKKKLTMCGVQAVKACYYATFFAAQAMLADRDILETYLSARKNEAKSIDITQSIAAVAFLTNAAMACEVVAAPWSLTSVGAFFTAGSWPTVLTVASPAGLAVSAVGLAVLGVSVFRGSQRKKEILYYQNLSILISRSCNVINEAIILFSCINHLDSDKSAGAADRYLENFGNKDFFQLWRAFIKEDKKKRNKRRKERRGVCAITAWLNWNSVQSSERRQVSRYIKKLMIAQESKLQACLDRFREAGELDPSTLERSGGELSDVTGDD